MISEMVKDFFLQWGTQAAGVVVTMLVGFFAAVVYRIPDGIEWAAHRLEKEAKATDTEIDDVIILLMFAAADAMRVALRRNPVVRARPKKE